MIRPFVIVGRPRTGTTFLRRTLTTHPDVVCHGELFAAKFLGVARPLLVSCGLDFDIERRNANPVAFLDAILACYDDKWVGFKLLLGQQDVVMNEVSRRGWPMIVLRRDNLLASYSSGLIVKATGQAHAYPNAEIKRATVEFVRAEFDRFIRRENDNWQLFFEKWCPRNDLLNLEYREIAFGDGLKRVLEFLGAKPSDLTPGLQKRNPDDMLARFVNPEAVVAHLQDIGHTEWLCEKPEP